MLDLEQLSDDAQVYFDGYVATGTDDELFASGYLRGHVDLVLGGALMQNKALTMDEFIELVEQSVNKAIKNGELEQSDVITVNNVLNGLLKTL
ncbi:YfcL family protein [Psychrosphaera sp. B3R10]|uniref:YfcL family protein n=1 Tax=Psychrosphaera algicola TaxID=3023714 RepID=A0ABT5FI67_9GAMM|nr:MULTISPECIES: YfcL family protein [unclassified Psychrosphaera]MBU2881597.1 YfcL family protein [Psychrosphaera sp. I2R16]MBU2991148.1 YfcL family protein [Psychrosphaera sp. B3R10]MDC2890892.1 YfcL family protein [Psychrosphaera sp. G1-22]